MDYELLFIQTIGILTVINVHYNCVNTLLRSLFPYDSWLAPIICFIPGIFFGRSIHKRKPLEFFWHKCQTLLFPSLFIHFCYGIISWTMRHYHFVEYGGDINFYSIFISPFLLNDQFANDTTIWFNMQLFIIEIIMLLLYLIPIKKQLLKDSVLLLSLLILSVFCIEWSRSIPMNTHQWLLPRRTGYLLVFFSFGIFYEHHIRQHLEKITHPIMGCYIIVIIQIIVMTATNWNGFYHHLLMGFNTVPYNWLPYFSFLTASFFLLFLAKYLSPLLKNSRMLRFIGPNLRYVVYHNQFCQIMIGVAALLIYITAGGSAVPRFNPIGFRNEGGYTFELSTNGFGKLIFLVIPFFVPIFIAKIINKTDNRLIRFIKWCILLCIILGFFILTGHIFQDGLRNIY